MREVLYPFLGFETNSTVKEPSKFFLEVCILDSYIRFFRNSCSSDLLYIYFDKLGVYSTG